MSFCAFLQGIFLIQGSKPLVLPLLHCWAGSFPLVPLGKPRYSDSESESCLTLCDQSMDFAVQSTGFSRPEYWSGEPFPSAGVLPNPVIKPRSPASQTDSLPAEPQGKPSFQTDHLNKITRRHADGPPHFYHLCLQTYRLVCFDTVRIMDFLTALYKSSSFLCPELGPSCF